jgi:flagellar motor switch protein FliN/FliY
MANDNVVDQNEIERLLGGGAAAAPPSPPAAPAPAPGENGVLSQEELNALFSSSGSAPLPAAPAAPAPPPPPQAQSSSAFTSPPPSAPAFDGWGGVPESAYDAAADDDEEGIPPGDLDYLAKRAEKSLQSIAAMPTSLPAEVIEFQFPEFGGNIPSTEHATLDQISEVDLDVKVELGRTYMYLEDVLKLRRGSVVPLDKMAGDTVDIYINGRLLARGEVLVMNENFCVRVAELLAGAIPME